MCLEDGAAELACEKSEAGPYTTPPLEGKMVTDTSTSSLAPVVDNVSGLWEEEEFCR